MDCQKSNLLEKQQLTPATIMVTDTISPVKSRILPKVLLDTGLTKTLINCKCLPKHCQPYKIITTRKVYTLIGSYNLSKIVIIDCHN